MQECTKQDEQAEEIAYLARVTAFLQDKIALLRRGVDLRKGLLRQYRREEEPVPLPVGDEGAGRGGAADFTQALLEDSREAASLGREARALRDCEQMLPSPYFARLDFKEDGGAPEKIYIGLHNAYDEEGGGDVLVYDWRAPVSSIFYEFEPGRASYAAPDGRVEGTVLRKRQYRIENARLRYFFDCGPFIRDELLGEALARNASPRMHSIVDTIQGEQDRVIRETESDLLMVQGAAGSGKTIIALHRVAYLLYREAAAGLSSRNILILSPGDVFSRYVSSVLPDLGEENAPELSFDALLPALGIAGAGRRAALAQMLYADPAALAAYRCKGSRAFLQVLRRFLRFYESRLLPFADLRYAGETVASGAALRREFLSERRLAPVSSRLRRLETRVLARLHPLERARHAALEAQFKAQPEHRLDYRAAARRAAVLEAQEFARRMRAVTSLAPQTVYAALFADRARFVRLCRGLPLAVEPGALFDSTARALQSGALSFADAAPMAYLAALMDPPRRFEEIRHVVVDEAQDYLPLHYAVLGLCFARASFTVLGDVAQAVEAGATMSLFDDIRDILGKKRPLLLTLRQSYRSSFEIMQLAGRVLPGSSAVTPFRRHEKPPEFRLCAPEALPERLARDIRAAKEAGFGTQAVLCRTREQAETLYARLRGLADVKLLTESGEVTSGAFVLPAYLAKGLEFDCVLLPGVSQEEYGGALGERLLYVACTRALHRLTLYFEREDELVRRLRGEPGGAR